MESPDTDYDIIVQIIDGDFDKFKIIVDKYRGLVFNIVRNMITEKMDREDIGQEIFLKVYSYLASFRFKSSMATWISRITYNTCLNHLRQNKKNHEKPMSNAADNSNELIDQSTTTIYDVLSQNIAPDMEVIKNEMANFIRSSIKTLPEKYRIVISLHYLEDFNLKEISFTIGVPIGTIKSILFRARKMLKDRLLSNFKLEDLFQ